MQGQRKIAINSNRKVQAVTNLIELKRELGYRLN